MARQTAPFAGEAGGGDGEEGGADVGSDRAPDERLTCAGWPKQQQPARRRPRALVYCTINLSKCLGIALTVMERITPYHGRGPCRWAVQLPMSQRRAVSSK